MENKPRRSRNASVCQLIVLVGLMSSSHTHGFEEEASRAGAGAAVRNLLMEEEECPLPKETLKVVDYSIDIELLHTTTSMITVADCNETDFVEIESVMNATIANSEEMKDTFGILEMTNDQICLGTPGANTRRTSTLSGGYVYYYVFMGNGRCRFCYDEDTDFNSRTLRAHHMMMDARSEAVAAASKVHAADDRRYNKRGLRSSRQLLEKRSERRHLKSDKYPTASPAPTAGKGKGGKGKGGKGKGKGDTPTPTSSPSLVPSEFPSTAPSIVPSSFLSDRSFSDSHPNLGTLQWFENQIPGLETILKLDIRDNLVLTLGNQQTSCLYDATHSDIEVKVHISVVTRDSGEYCQSSTT